MRLLSGSVISGTDFSASDIEWTWFRDRVLAPWVVGPVTRLNPRWPGYEDAIDVPAADWDVLVILDACRADVFEETADLEAFDDYRRVVSRGSHSSEWIRRNFGSGSFGDIVYVSANPHTNLVAHDAFHDILELWDTHYDEERGTVLPADVVKAARDADETYPDKRLIVHFMQPHGPLIGADESVPFDSDEAYWQAYTETLEHVLPYAMEVADTVRGKTVLTADHGQINYDGVWRHLGLKSHKPRLRLPGLVEVPWGVLEDERRPVATEAAGVGSQDNVEERLRDLGYVT